MVANDIFALNQMDASQMLILLDLWVEFQIFNNLFLVKVTFFKAPGAFNIIGFKNPYSVIFL